MAHPYHHAVHSARAFGGTAGDYLSIHSWFDATKAHTAHTSHRIFRHHAEGCAEAAEIFGQAVVNSDGAEVSVEVIGRQHCEDDFAGAVPSIADWLESIDLPPWAAPPPASNSPHQPSESQAEICRRRFGGQPADYQPLLNWFSQGVSHDDRRTMFRRYHAAGIFDAETRFGITLPINGRRVPTRVVAEAIVLSAFGRCFIPSPLDWVAGYRRPSWVKQPIKLSIAA